MELKDKLSPELYEQVSTELGDVKVIVNDGSYIPKSRLNEEIDKKKALQTQVTTLTSSLDEMKGSVKSVEELESALNQTTETLAKAKADYESNLISMSKTHKFESALDKMKPKNAKAVKALFDMEKISVDGDNLIGFSEQAESIKIDNSFLFEQAKKDVDTDNGDNGVFTGKNPFKAESLSYSEQIILKKTKPALYAKLKKEAGK